MDELKKYSLRHKLSGMTPEEILLIVEEQHRMYHDKILTVQEQAEFPAWLRVAVDVLLFKSRNSLKAYTGWQVYNRELSKIRTLQQFFAEREGSVTPEG